MSIDKKRTTEDILRNYMNMTDYAYHHCDLGMLDIDYADFPEDERLDMAADNILHDQRDMVAADYEKDLAEFLNGYEHMKVALSQKEGFDRFFLPAPGFCDSWHAWDACYKGYLLRYILRWSDREDSLVTYGLVLEQGPMAVRVTRVIVDKADDYSVPEEYRGRQTLNMKVNGYFTWVLKEKVE